MDRVYENIRKRRKELHMTQKELADKCGYTDHTTINKMEKGLVDITLGRLRQIAAALDTTPFELMEGESDEVQKANLPRL